MIISIASKPIVKVESENVRDVNINMLSSIEGLVTVMFPMICDVHDIEHRKQDDIDDTNNPTFLHNNKFVSTNFDYVMYNDEEFLEKSRLVSMVLSSRVFSFDHIENIASISNLIPYIKPRVKFEKNIHLYSPNGKKYAIIDKKGNVRLKSSYILSDTVLFGELYRILSVATKEESTKRDGQLILKYGRNVLYTYENKYYTTIDNINIKDLSLTVSSLLFRNILFKRVEFLDKLILGDGDLQLIMIMDSVAFQISNILRIIDEDLYKMFIRNRLIIEKLHKIQ